MKSETRTLLCWAATFYALAGSLVAFDRPCGSDEPKRAEMATDNLKNWKAVYGFYKRFLRCDDGGVAEGVSDAIAKLLANHWEHFSDFAKLASTDKGFEQFVVRHVDETIDSVHDAPKISENARLHCPSNSVQLCKIIISKTVPQNK